MQQLSVHQFIDAVPRLVGLEEDTAPKLAFKFEEGLINQFLQSFISDSLTVLISDSKVSIVHDIDLDIQESEIHKIAIIVKDKGQVVSIDSVDSIILSVSDDHSIFNRLRTILNLGLMPLFETVSRTKKGDSDSFVTVTRKKFNELSNSLQNLQEKIQVPNLVSSVHPAIKEFETEQQNFDNSLLEDSNLLNEVTHIVNGWIKEIQSITNLSSNLDNQSSITEEIQFWTSLDISLSAIEDQLSAVQIKNSINLLNRAKRFHVTLSFTNDTNLTDKILETKTNLALLKDLPMSELLSINPKDKDCLTKFMDVVTAIFNHLKRLRTINSFPLEKALLLTELILKDIVIKLSSLINSFSLLTIDLSDFITLFDTAINEIFSTIDLNIKYMINLIRELLRKRHEKFIVVRINQDVVDQMKLKLEALKAFRVKHENLLFITRNFLHDIDQESRLIDEYNRLASLNALDFTKHGIFNWTSSEKLYNQIYDNIQASITSTLNGLFLDCRDFKDYVLVADKYKYLKIENTFDILALMKEDLRLKILEVATTEVKSIVKFDSSFNDTFVSHLTNFMAKSEITDSTIATFIRCLSVNEKLAFYTQNLIALVGEEWHKYSIGKKLSDQISSFSLKYDPELIFNSFMKDLGEFLDSNKLESRGKIIKKINTGLEDQLIVNFNFEFFKYKQNLLFFQNLGFKIPVATLLELQKLNKLSPLIQNLQETLSTIKNIDKTLTKDYGKKFLFLLESDKKKLDSDILKLCDINWEHLIQALELQDLEHDVNTTEIQSFETVLQFQKLVSGMVVKANTISKLNLFLNDIYYKLRACKFEVESIQEVLNKLHNSISDAFVFDDTALSDLINEEINDILCLRCKDCMEEYGDSLLSNDNKKSSFSISIIQKDGIFTLEPSLDELKTSIYNKLNSFMQIIESCMLLNKESASLKPEILSSSIAEVFSKVDKFTCQFSDYFDNWVQVEHWIGLDLLNDIDVNSFAAINILDQWYNAIQKVWKLRSLFDSDIHQIGSCLIYLENIQTKTFLRFENFQKQITKIFGDIFQSQLYEFINNSEKTIESLNFNTLDSKGFTENLITYLNAKADISGDWKAKVLLFGNCSNIFSKMGFKYPSNWVYMEQIESKISIIHSILSKKDTIITENHQLIEARTIGLVNELEENIVKFQEEWSVKRPVAGDMNPVMVLNSLTNLSSTCFIYLKSKEDLSLIAQTLGFEIPEIEIKGLNDTGSEISDYKQVWSSINSLHEQIELLRKLKWSLLKIKDVRVKLENLLQEGRLLPIQIRQYAAFDELQQSTKNLLKQQKYLMELKNEYMKERHWLMLLTSINFKGKIYQSFTLGDVWDLNLPLHESLIKSIVTQAINEHTLEESVHNIKQRWTEISFDYFNLAGKYKLIKSWDVLFETCSQDLNELASMRNSSSFGAFEQDVTLFENKLNKFYTILDIWIEVQRQWVYLEGMFSNRNNISNILPIEAARFNNLTYGMFDLMRKVYKVDFAIDVLHIPDFDKQLEKLLESFVKLRRSLSDFLEKQRETFGRFYFIGNEDLLELIGSDTDFNKINRHINKLFSGIASLKFNNDISCITAMVSSEQEVVEFKEPISLIKYPTLIEWLTRLELEMKLTLIASIKQNLPSISLVYENLNLQTIPEILKEVPNQIILLCLQILFTNDVEKKTLKPDNIFEIIQALSHLVFESDSLIRKKIENVLVELIHQHGISERVLKDGMSAELAYYFDETSESLTVKQMNNTFYYGFEYLGVSNRLVYTPLIDKCFFAMTQALGQKLGGSPFGPAGTGKTESIKALGDALGKMVTVFCCDESFDFQAMSRIFLGLCKTGCWGCFDEFNRLDEKLLSAVSSQIETIEFGLKDKRAIELSGKKLKVNPETGIFITMNPGYVGRNELPENLKKLFRSFSMESPDREIIVDVLLASHGFQDSKSLSNVIVPFFMDLEQKCSKQSHYDFGLRAIKSVLNSCGRFKRQNLLAFKENHSEKLLESLVVLQSICQSIRPKLIKEDDLIFNDLRRSYFEDEVTPDTTDKRLKEIMIDFGTQKGFIMDQTEKLTQLYELQQNHHGIIMVGKSGAGKSTCRDILSDSMAKFSNKEHVNYIIDAKVLSKEEIYGQLDSVTREWTDGLFTSILRKIRSNLRGEMNKTSWIIFDGDIDPEWAENLNSVLDDNKILTLPTGERIELPENVRIIFETDNLEFTTLATISRCGMIWFEEVEIYAVFEHELSSAGEDVDIKDFISFVKNMVSPNILYSIIKEAEKCEHIMEFDAQRAVKSFVSLLLSKGLEIIQYCKENSHSLTIFSDYIKHTTLVSCIWSFVGDGPLKERENFGKGVAKVFDIEDMEVPFIDCDVSLPDGEWIRWESKVEMTEMEPHKVSNPNIVIQTTDTARHESLIHSVLTQHKTLLLCGPPGSGKTMTFLEVLKKNMQLDVLQLNFSKESSPESLMKSLNQYCEYQRTSNGTVFQPKVAGKWVVVFCDEINLPGPDKYGCQTVISFIRQMIEHQGFWDTKNKHWVQVKNVQFVGACNSPKDPGRHKLSDRFLRHSAVVMVDYPGKTSLEQIYGTFNSAAMKLAPDMRGYSQSITKAMIDIYFQTKDKLADVQSHYIYSPRELTRWTRGILEALKRDTYTDLSKFLRLWYHEGLRLFYDRLVAQDERVWTKELFKSIFNDHFPGINTEEIMKEPILFSDWLSDKYTAVSKESLADFVSHRLATFSEEEFDVDLVVYEDVLDHALRIDRVLRQPQGHMILAGNSTTGKTTLTKFVSWINGLKPVQLYVRNNYGIDDFDKDLRNILLRCVKGEQICYIIDEASIIETSFIERMNTLLANSEIPGLFEDEDLTKLMNICLEESQAQGLLLDSNDELYKWFSQQISKNLHVVFTITDLADSNRLQVISSPALFNRCVLSYMGNWSLNTLEVVGKRKIEELPIDTAHYQVPETYVPIIPKQVLTIRDAVLESLVFVHNSGSKNKYPGQFLSLVDHFIENFSKKHSELEDDQRHTTNGLNKLRETVLQVANLKEQLSKKQIQLTAKDKEAREMLDIMLSEQNEAERKQEFSITAQEELNKQEVEIEKRRRVVLKDLEEAEPAILEARRGVQNIKKHHLTEIRSMANPPAAVKMTMESVCILIGYQVSSWRDVQSAVRKDDFIPTIVNYNNEEQLTDEVRDYMEKTYLSRPEFTFETVNRASKSCGPLLLWVRAQLTYASALNKVGPLKEEVDLLEAGAKKTRAQLYALEEMVKELEVKIDKYKHDYSSLIRETENIKMEMESVEQKVGKSVRLMENLQSERERWKNSTIQFKSQAEKIIGTSLIISAFVVYSGEYDHKDREVLLKSWRKMLIDVNIPFDDAISVISLFPQQLDTEKIKQKNNEEVVAENMVIIGNNKVPLIIDPAGDSVEFKGLISTSFLSESFVRDLENAVRFGGSLLIKDFERYDPILDPILRSEVSRNGGRQLIRIGDQILDYNLNFKLYLHTRDPNIKLTPFVESRVSPINFTITSRDLESQVLNLALKITEPETETKRKELIVAQSKNKMELLALEHQLLDSLAAVKGNILDDDTVIEHLDSLKSQTNSIDVQMKESKAVLDKIDQIRNKYYDVAVHASLIFQLLQKISGYNRFYNFSLAMFKGIFSKVIECKGNIIIQLYIDTFASVSWSLTELDKKVFAFALGVVYYGQEIGSHFTEFVKEWLNEKDPFKVLFLEGNTEELALKHQDNEVVKALAPLLLAKSPYELSSAIKEISSFLYSGTGPYSSKYPISHFIQDKPVLLTSVEGYDASFKIEQLANSKGITLSIVSLGSREGIEAAKREIQTGSRKGGWLLIHNIQMSPEWLTELEQLIASETFTFFKLFLTCTLTSKIPETLVNQCQVLVFENQPTLKDVVLETFDYYDITDKPSEYKFIYFLTVWYHSLVVTRMNYVPVSFSKRYDINDSDFHSAIHSIDKILEPLMEAGTNISPKNIPFDKIKYLIGDINYGGKIDNKKDLEYFQNLSKIFDVESFDTDIIDGKLPKPDGITVEKYREWISQLPDNNPVEWMELESIEEVMLKETNSKIVSQIANIL